MWLVAPCWALPQRTWHARAWLKVTPRCATREGGGGEETRGGEGRRHGLHRSDEKRPHPSPITTYATTNPPPGTNHYYGTLFSIPLPRAVPRTGSEHGQGKETRCRDKPSTKPHHPPLIAHTHTWAVMQGSLAKICNNMHRHTDTNTDTGHEANVLPSNIDG